MAEANSLLARGEQISSRHAEVALVRAAIEAYEAEALQERTRFLSAAARGRPEVRPESGRTLELRHGGRPTRCPFVASGWTGTASRRVGSG